VPLLFERGMEEFFDVTVLVYAPRKIQRARLMKRDGLLEDMADRILDQQMDIELKRSKSDLVIDNSHTEEELRLEVQQFLRTILL
jgi:dephospho-CoA kinase